jgi:hypothetical protein
VGEFGFSLLFSQPQDVPVVREHLLKNLDDLITPSLYISHWYEGSYIDIPSPFYPDELWFDGLPMLSSRWQIIYTALEQICKQLQGKLAVEYQHPQRPDDPYYMLVFDKNGVSLGDDSEWEDTLNIAIIETNFTLQLN